MECAEVDLVISSEGVGEGSRFAVVGDSPTRGGDDRLRGIGIKGNGVCVVGIVVMDANEEFV